MKDGEADFSKYTAEQIGRSLSRIDREKFPLNYANLLAAQQALPPPIDAAEVEAHREADLADLMANGDVWLSAAWTPLLNTLAPALLYLPVPFLIQYLFVDLIGAGRPVDLGNWHTLEGYVYVIAGVVCLPLLAWHATRMRRVVMSKGQLEVHSHFTSTRIDVQDIEQIRWNDAPAKHEARAALVDLRVRSALGRRILFMPRSRENMRAFAAHVARLQGRNVADPAFKSKFYVGTVDP